MHWLTDKVRLDDVFINIDKLQSSISNIVISMIKIVGIQDKKPQQISVVKVGTSFLLIMSRIYSPYFRVLEPKLPTRQYSRILSRER